MNVKTLASLLVLAICVVVLPLGGFATDPDSDPAQPHSPENIPAIPSPSAPPESPSPSPPPPECTYIEGKIKWEGEDHGSVSDAFRKSGDLSKLGCIDNLINQVKNACANRDWYELKGYNDDCYAFELASRIFPDYVNHSNPKVKPKYRQMKAKIGVHSNGAVCERAESMHSRCPAGVLGHCKHCATGHFLIDRNTCQVIASPNGQKCGNFALHWSEGCPVSLIWEKGADIGAERTVAFFSLTPNAQWSVWKGSAKTPVLVYDPEHTGVIKSAAQLFGNWAFGGQAAASLQGAGVNPRPWANGYEALASLDRDRNGKVDGAELAPLGLWFDENRDAVSQPGEVKPAAELGIKALYYTPDFTDPVSKDIRVDRGFDREVAGRLESGASVDWFTETASTPMDLIHKYSWEDLGRNLTEQEAAAQEEGPAEQEPEVEAAPRKPGPFSGIWAWTMDIPGHTPQGKDGYLLFAGGQSEGNMIGFSLIERPLERSPQPNIKSGGGMFALTGRTSKSDGKETLMFESEYNGSRMVNKAQLSADGNSMSGTSTVHQRGAQGNVTLSYSWTAVRQ